MSIITDPNDNKYYITNVINYNKKIDAITDLKKRIEGYMEMTFS